ncbi:uncharacterized protein LOC133200630 [Saccostrea echinata]|uniref:uncharacterized protein LOC133200630 n=1 Tax=Saccostrea echinata TaxID=191078 RepID=UPI002A831451|nr:uncharacterized protein LOC133200630 [Saccostrea echinata]
MGCQMMCSPNQSKDNYDFRKGCSKYEDSTIAQSTKTNYVEKKTTSRGFIFNTKDISFSSNKTAPQLSSFPTLKISVLGLLAVFLVMLILYLFFRKCVKTEEQVEEHLKEENNHYEDVREIQVNP